MTGEIERKKEATVRMPDCDSLFAKLDYINSFYMTEQSRWMLTTFVALIAEKELDGTKLFEAWDTSLATTYDFFDRTTKPPSSAVIFIAYSSCEGGIGFDRVIYSLELPKEVAWQAKFAREKAALEYMAKTAIR